MAKRGADNQLTKDDRSEDEEEEGVRDTPLAPKEGRQIRGLPKRRTQAAATPAGESIAPSASGSALPASNPFAASGFSFGSTAAKAPTFGATTSSDDSSKPPSSGPIFSFGPSASAVPAPSTSTPAASPFSGFSFTSPSTTSSTAAKSTPSFGFGAKPATLASTAPASDASASKPALSFSFGTQSTAPSANGVKVPSFGSQSATPTNLAFSFGAPASDSSLSTTLSSGAKIGDASGSSGANKTSSLFPTSAPEAAPQSAAAPATSIAAAPLASESSASTNGMSAHDLSPSQSELPLEGEVTYYTSVRGLNTSLLSFLTSTVEKDQFVDLSSAIASLHTQYQKYLEEAADKAGWRPSGTASAPEPGANGTVNGFTSESSASQPPAPPAVPTSVFTPFLPTPASAKSETSPPAGAGFVPKAAPAKASSSSPFQFGGAPKPTTAPKPSAEVTKLVEAAIADTPGDEQTAEPATGSSEPSKLQDGATTRTTTSSPPAKTGSLFSFAPSRPLHPATAESETFSPSTNIETASSTSTPAKLGKFGPGGSQPQLTFGGAKTSPIASTSPTTQKAVGFGFGASAPAASAAASSFGFGSSGSSGFSFGAKPATESTPTSNPFSFGAKPPSQPPSATTPSFSFDPKPPTGSTPSFSFGATSTASKPLFSLGSDPDKPPPTSASAAAFASSTPPLSFGTSTAPSTALPSADGSAEATPEPSSPSKNLAELGGAGEENEETVIEVRGKLYHFEEGANKLDGLGLLKVKRANTEGASGDRKRRLLMRADGSGNIILNMSLSKHFEPTTDNAWVKFLGFDAKGTGRPYSLRVKTAQAATELVEAMKKEVADIKE